MKQLAVLLLLAGITTTTYAAERSRYVVALRQGPRGATALAAVADPGGNEERRLRRFRSLDAFAADLTADEVAALRASGGALFVDPVVPRSSSEVLPAAPFRTTPRSEALRLRDAQVVPYGLQMIRAREVWAVTRGTSVNVVVCDSGIDATHPELAARYQGGFNAFTGQPGAPDDRSHGTHVAGLIAAADNDAGIIGVAPDVRLWAVKVLDSKGAGTDETVAASIDWAIEKKRSLGGRWILNFSLGAASPSRLEEAAVARAVDEGLLLVCAAGNSGFAQIDYPAKYRGVVSVGAVGPTEERAAFSSYGDGLQLVAPGVSNVSTMPLRSVEVSDVAASDNTLLDAIAHQGGPFGDMSGDFVYCGLGRPQDYPPDVAGKIALIRRGEIEFRQKARYAREAGATGVLIFNDPSMRDDRSVWTLRACDLEWCEEDQDYPFPVTLGLSSADGLALMAKQGKVTLSISHRYDDYAAKSGTSMATPHATGVAALLWSLAPDATAHQIFLALKFGAKDLYTLGWDPNTGYGMIDAAASARLLAPALFGLPPGPPLSEPRRRTSSR